MSDHDDTLREFTAALFGTTPDRDPDDERPSGNFSPREGGNPRPIPGTDLREWVNDLMNPPRPDER